MHKIVVSILAFLAVNIGFYAQQDIVVVENDSMRIEVELLGPEINSDFDDYAPVITADGETIYFTSRRSFTDREKKRNRESNERIYYAEFDEEENQWNEAESMPESVNLPRRNTSNVAISNDGQRLLIYKDDRYGNGNIFETYAKGNDWSEPVSISDEVNSEFHESSASISPDGKTIYFVSERKGGIGKRDIWKATKNNDGTWGKAENLGNVINTKHDEEAVYIHPDGKTLYFSSKGHKGLGGYDVFKSTYVNGKWTKPVNLGAPINSDEDDLFFVLAANGKKGYYATARGGGVKNIYEIRFIPIDKEKEDKGPDLTVFKGVIKECDGKTPIYADIEVVDNETDEIVGTYNSNESTGKYLISLPSGRNYGVNVNAKGYLFSSHSFDLSNDSVVGYNEVKKDLCLDKIKVGSKVVLNNIFFDYAKATLRKESKNELMRLKRILDESPNLKIEIGGHTDNRGADDYNNRLSKNRARSVVNYLVENGIDRSRITYKGYGKSQPVATNDTEEGRQENRRVEFKVISN